MDINMDTILIIKNLLKLYYSENSQKIIFLKIKIIKFFIILYFIKIFL